MSTDFSVRPVGAPVAIPLVRAQPDAVKNAVPTELPSPKATAAVDPSTSTRNDPQTVNIDLSHDIIIDHAAGAVVHRTVDDLTGAVVWQFPDEAQLRSRAYQRAIDEAKLTHTPVQYNLTA